MQFGKITQVAHYVPEKIVTNDDLSTMLETSDEWISTRTGIRRRHIAVNENTSDLCIEVAKKLLEKAEIDPSELDFVLVATMTPDFATPSTASLVQGAIGATRALAFDISAACSGFVYALTVAEKFILSGSKKGIVIGGECLSKIVDWQDRTTAVLFGDGAGGVLLEANDTQHILAENLRSDGVRGRSLTAMCIKPQLEFSSGFQNEPYLKMDGRDIFDFAVRDVPQNILETLERAKLSVEEIDTFLLHQANMRIIDKMARKVKAERSKFPTNMDKYGNTSAASIPILLSEEVEKGRVILGSNQKLVLTGFGGGLTWGTLVVTV
ncbi:beta-ketoacyl-ACP synthase III [Pilibacter termitis]|nr:beta-ketoacyl-ACP synthase III [Pilibacter termitis]